MTDFEYDKQNQEVVDMVNNHYAEINRPKSKYEELKKKIISRISGKKEPKIIISFNHTNIMDRYAITTSDGQNVGVINIATNIKTALELSKKRPLFKIYKNDEPVYELDITNNLVYSDYDKYNNQEMVSDIVNSNQSAITATKTIYEFIDNQDYDSVEKYIVKCMEELIANKNVDINPNFREIFENAQNLIRNIHKKKTEIGDKMRTYQDYTIQHKELDAMYREICMLFLNYGMYDLPAITTEEFSLK